MSEIISLFLASSCLCFPAYGKQIQVAQQVVVDRDIDVNDWQKDPAFGEESRKERLQEAVFKSNHAEEIATLKAAIRYYPNFPKDGVLFADFSPLLSDARNFQSCLELLKERYQHRDIDVIVGLESRGFIIGAALAAKMEVGFVPVRKPGKLPGNIHTVTYQKEYGEDSLTIVEGAFESGQNVLIIDDLIATGGSANAAIELVKLAGGNPVEFATILEVSELNGRQKLNIPSFNLID